MEPQEIDSALDELENRLDRLRSLYEQYFMGIEKIEPTVPRKDVDRRFWILRRTPIRNTARRFRLQTLTQRYNTFQQHWTRICREIENGTYVRHLLKAQKNLGADPKTWAAKKRLGLLRRDRLDGAAPTDTSPPSAAPPSAAAGGLSSRPSPSTGDVGSRGPASAEARARSTPPRPAAASPAAPAAATARSALAEPNLAPLDLDLDDAPTLPPPAGGFRPAVKPAAPAAPVSGSRPSPIPLPGARARSGSAIPRPPAIPSGPAMAPAPGGALPGRVAAAPGAVPGNAAPRPGLPSPPRPSPSRPPAAPAAPMKGPTTQVAAAAAARPVAPVAQPATTPGVVGTRQAATPGAAAVPAVRLAPSPGAVGSPAVRQAGAPAAVPAAKPAAGAAVPAAAGLSDERVRQLHADLSSARQKLNQASSISVDSLAKSLRESEAKLRAQHGGRSVDFQVVIKDGKPIVKPVVRR